MRSGLPDRRIRFQHCRQFLYFRFRQRVRAAGLDKSGQRFAFRFPGFLCIKGDFQPVLFRILVLFCGDSPYHRLPGQGSGFFRLVRILPDDGAVFDPDVSALKMRGYRRLLRRGGRLRLLRFLRRSRFLRFFRFHGFRGFFRFRRFCGLLRFRGFRGYRRSFRFRRLRRCRRCFRFNGLFGFRRLIRFRGSGGLFRRRFPFGFCRILPCFRGLPFLRRGVFRRCLCSSLRTVTLEDLLLFRHSRQREAEMEPEDNRADQGCDPFTRHFHRFCSFFPSHVSDKRFVLKYYSCVHE